MSNYQFTYDEVNLIRQWFNHIQDTSHKDYLKRADILLGQKLIQVCRDRRVGPIGPVEKPVPILYKWFRVGKLPRLGEQPRTFIWFSCYETASGRFACQVLEVMGVSRESENVPALVIHLTPRYFKNQDKRREYIQRLKDYWELK